MIETIQLGDLSIQVSRKAIKHVHLSVHPPNGRVTLSAPSGTRLEVARAYAISKLGWIREQQTRLRSQARETPRRFIGRESHYVWGNWSRSPGISSNTSLSTRWRIFWSLRTAAGSSPFFRSIIRHGAKREPSLTSFHWRRKRGASEPGSFLCSRCLVEFFSGWCRFCEKNLRLVAEGMGRLVSQLTAIDDDRH